MALKSGGITPQESQGKNGSRLVAKIKCWESIHLFRAKNRCMSSNLLHHGGGKHGGEENM